MEPSELVLELGDLVGLGDSQASGNISGALWKPLGPAASWLSVWAEQLEKHLEQATPGLVQSL